MRNDKIKQIVLSGVIAALYVLLSFVSDAFSMTSGVIQVRISEALCILPIFTPSAIPGLFIGCLLCNIISGCMILDVVFGSLTSLIAAVLTYCLRKKHFVAMIPPIALNTLVIPFILKYVYEFGDMIYIMFLTVFIGEFISVGILGQILYTGINKNREAIFK